MAFKIKYINLFEVRLLHYYYINNGTTVFDDATIEQQLIELREYDAREVFDIQPTMETQKLFNSHKLLLRKTEIGFFVAVKVDSSDPTKAFLEIDTTTTFRFRINIKNRFFSNMTALPLTGNAGQIYHYSNRAGNNGASFPDLALPAPIFSAGDDYGMGDLVRDGADLYEAIRNTNNATAIASNPDWNQLITRAYTSISDRESAGSFAIPFPAFVAGDSYNSGDKVTSSGSIYEALINTSLTTDIAVNSDWKYIRKLPLGEGISPKDFALIDILADDTLGAYSLFDGSKNLLSPTFDIRFKNRSTIWRYIFQEDQVPANIVGLVQETIGDDKHFITSSPTPLSNNYLEIQNTGSDDILPNPDIRIIIPEIQQIFSEIYL